MLTRPPAYPLHALLAPNRAQAFRMAERLAIPRMARPGDATRHGPADTALQAPFSPRLSAPGGIGRDASPA